MKSLKSYFKNDKSEKAAELPVPEESLSPKLDPNVIASRRISSRTTSSLIASSFVNEEDIMNMKTDVMAEWLYKQQRLKLWASPAAEEGAIIKRSRGEYACCPEDLQYTRGGLFDFITAMNVACAMTIATNVISIFVSCQEGDTASLQGGLSIQILPSMSYLPRCLKHQFAAFIRDRQILVVWDDDPEKIVEHATRLETLLMVSIWNSGTNNADEERDYPNEKVDQLGDAEEQGIGLEYEQPRRRMLLSSFIVAGTLVLIMGSIGLGWRKLALQVIVDGNYLRLSLVIISPIIFFVGLFTMQSIIGCLCQIFGPINQVGMNTKGYSGKAPQRITARPYPHITVQMPVYKEGLNAVIKPTVMSIKRAISTYELQGGTANIFINDDGMQIISPDEAARRQEFYEEHGIGWVARPKHNPRPKKPQEDFDESKLFVRKGKFKKASNMNYALMVSNKVEDKLADVQRQAVWTKEMENDAYRQCFHEVLQELDGRAWAAGNIRVGDYILLIDSDTRVPHDCLLDAASEMEQCPEVAIMQFSSGVMKVTNSFFESGITFFTNLIYTAICYAVASGDVCPFVGHNAILRWSAVQQVTYMDEDGYEKFWSESHVSEDFDMALRLQCDGYQIRLAAYQGDGFKEGVSLTVYDELARWEKYAYGCNELLFHPIRKWFWRGPFTPLFKKFMGSNMPIGAKLTIMAYISTYYAIGAGWILTVANYFIMGWFLGYIDQFYLDSFAIYFGVIVVFTALSNVALAVLRYRTAASPLLPALFENFKWVPLLAIFLGGISIHISHALLAHMFELDMSWGATSKEVEDTTFFVELPRLIRKFKLTFFFCLTSIAVMVAGAFFFPALWRINTLVAIYPLATVVAGHMLLPIVLNPALMMFTW